MKEFVFLFTAAIVLASPFFPAFAENHKIEFRKDGDSVRTLSVDELRSIVPDVALEVFEAHERRNRTYRAMPVGKVFDHVFGKGWNEAQEAVFTSLDGFQPIIPVRKILNHDAYLAFADAGAAPFTLTNKLQNNEVVLLAPLYLIWDNIGSKALLEAGASDMPYQIVRIELKTRGSFPHMIPPKDSPGRVQQGFRQFRQHCAACHTVNGEGGAKAPELNYPVSVTEYIHPRYLKRWIMEPQSIRYNTLMPGLGEEMPDRDKVADEIIAYLEAMSRAKRKPAHENRQAR